MKEQIAAFLREIPSSNQTPIALSDFVKATDLDFMRGYAHLLQTFGVVVLEGDAIQATSQTAKYWLNSLIEMVENDAPIVPDWKKRGLYPDASDNPLQNGATFLRWLEEQRQITLTEPTPSRVTKVAQVLIKRTNPQTRHPELLFQYDKNAGQYQLIGGRHSEANDDSILQTMTREIEEELAVILQYETDYALNILWEGFKPAPSISTTFGALTQYDFTFYHMEGLKSPLPLGELDRWVSVEEVLNGSVIDGEVRHPFSSPALYITLDQHLNGGLAGLKDSFYSPT